MTTTDIAPDSVAVDGQQKHTFIERLVTSTSSLSIGKSWINTGLFYLISSSLLGFFLDIVRFDTDRYLIFSNVDTFFQFWSLNRTALVLLSLIHI